MGHVNMIGSDKLIPEDAYEKVKSIDHIVKIEKYLLAMRPKSQGHDNFAMHIGIELGAVKRLESHGEVGSPRIIAGRDLTDEELEKGADVAIIGKEYAEWLGITPEKLPAKITIDPSLSSNSIYAVKGAPREIEVVGIFASGYVFGDLQLYIPYKTFKKIYPANGISWLYITVDSAEYVPAVSERLRKIFGKSIDVNAPISSAVFETATSKRIQKLSAFTIANAMLLAVIVIFLTMTLIARKQVREIGTLKALGATNAQVTIAFAFQAFVFVIAGAIVGMLIYATVGSTVITKFFELTMKSFLPVTYQTVFDAAGVKIVLNPFSFIFISLSAIAVGVLGSLQGLHAISKISPKEAMQNE
jgi:ABC-type antimicrobial peptide transport system permease subunit